MKTKLPRLPKNFTDNWFAYVTASWKRFLLFELVMLVPGTYIFFFLATRMPFPYKDPGFWMKKANRKETNDALWAITGLLLINFGIQWLLIWPLHQTGIVCCK